MKTYIVKLVVVDDLGTWGYGDLEHPQAQYILAKTMCAFALMYITQKSKSHWKIFYSQKREKSLPITIEKCIYICMYVYFCYNN